MEIALGHTGTYFGFADENNFTEKLACKWQSGVMPLVEGLGKDSQGTWGTQQRAKGTNGLEWEGHSKRGAGHQIIVGLWGVHLGNLESAIEFQLFKIFFPWEIVHIG